MTATATISKKDISKIPQMLSGIPDSSLITITINIETPIELTSEYQQASNFVEQMRKTPGRNHKVQSTMQQKSDLFTKLAAKYA